MDWPVLVHGGHNLIRDFDSFLTSEYEESRGINHQQDVRSLDISTELDT
jgi:hypothetical protein